MLERLTALQDVLLRAAKGATHPELMAFLQSEIIRCRQALGYPVNEASLSGEEATSSPSAPARVDGPVGCVVVVRWETGTGRPLRYAVALDPTAGQLNATPSKLHREAQASPHCFPLTTAVGLPRLARPANLESTRAQKRTNLLEQALFSANEARPLHAVPL